MQANPARADKAASIAFSVPRGMLAQLHRAQRQRERYRRQRDQHQYPEPRAATGIIAEYDNNKDKYPGLAIDQHLLIYSPSATWCLQPP